MNGDLKYHDLREIAATQPELTSQLLELQELAEQMGGNPEDWIAFTLQASALGQAYVVVAEENKIGRLPDGW